MVTRSNPVKVHREHRLGLGEQPLMQLGAKICRMFEFIKDKYNVHQSANNMAGAIRIFRNWLQDDERAVPQNGTKTMENRKPLPTVRPSTIERKSKGNEKVIDKKAKKKSKVQIRHR